MNLDYLRYFVALAHNTHYTNTAQQLCITQPTLSHAISQLEDELNIKLFEKQGRKTLLTKEGQDFLNCAEQSLSILDQGIEAIRKSNDGNGTIRLGFLRTLGINYIPHLTSKYLNDNPNIKVDFTFHTDTTEKLLDDLSNRKVDLIFCSKPIHNQHLITTKIMSQKLVLITPKNHELSKFKSIDLKQTLPYSQIFFSKTTGIRNVIDQIFDQYDSMPNIVYETEDDHVIAGLVSQGFGISIVPKMDILNKLEVNVIQIKNPTFKWNFYMMYYDNVYLSPAVQKFKKYVQKNTEI